MQRVNVTRKEKEKKEDWKIVAELLVNQSDRQRIKSVWTRRTHTLQSFLPDGRVVVVVFFIRSFLVRTHFFVLVKRAFSFFFHHLEIELKACVTSGTINRMEKKKKKKECLYSKKKHTTEGCNICDRKT
jgi:hypothetical protein